jgi:ankyrin repeat protein
MACRRGYTEIVRYMIHEAHVSVRIKDDCGRTPFHDACWNQNTNIEILDMLMKEDPLLFLVSDNRGSTAFEYARHEHWPVWRKFLHDRSSYFDTVEDSTAKYFMAKP